MIKRFGFLFLLNFLIIVSISFVINFLGLSAYITQYGIDYPTLIVFCLVWGFGGSFVSLLLSKSMAKNMMNLYMINEYDHPKLYNMVKKIAIKANIRVPEIGVYNSNEINAFATGYSRNSSLVAFSTGLLDSMDDDELEGVIAHEIAHIENGDMVSMTLLQGMVNAFVMFLARVLGSTLGGRNEDDHRPNFLMVFILELVFSFLGMFLLAYYSRQREFKADADGARMASKNKMIKALERLRNNYEVIEEDNSAISSMKISNKKSRFLSLLSTHPDLSDRINKLKEL